MQHSWAKSLASSKITSNNTLLVRFHLDLDLQFDLHTLNFICITRTVLLLMYSGMANCRPRPDAYILAVFISHEEDTFEIILDKNCTTQIASSPGPSQLFSVAC